MGKQLVIVGMGGHSKVVADVAQKNGYVIQGFFDDRKPMDSKRSYLGTMEEAKLRIRKDMYFFLAIGNNHLRKQTAESLSALGANFATLIDSTAVIGADVTIQPGTIVMPGAIVNADTRIGKHAIINTGATVDHDCRLEDYVHISPGVHLAGEVAIGTATHVGIGASVIQQLQIGGYATIGAGAVVINDIPAYSVAVGVPAKVIKTEWRGSRQDGDERSPCQGLT
jgi:acetyltransferase EpsM